jgi:hypothetical protein
MSERVKLSPIAAIAFKVPAEPGWRVVFLTETGEAAPEGQRVVKIIIAPVRFWGVMGTSHTCSPYDALAAVFMGQQPHPFNYVPLGSEAMPFDGELRAILSPADNAPDTEVLLSWQRILDPNRKAADKSDPNIVEHKP